MEFEKAKCELKNAIYRIASHILEKHEHAGRIYGNRHHAAQKIAENAGIELLLRWKVEEANAIKCEQG